MRKNLPVTDHELRLEPGKPIVTKTDLKGRITYANESFVNISGFTREELLGQAHNVVRHPDMPEEAFSDLWRTLKAGLPWRGLVKNRAKNGDFYWVDAYATPITELGKPVGYISVRSMPTREAIAAGESLYARVRDKSTKFPPTRLPSGKGWIATRLALPCVIGLTAVLAAAALSGPGAWVAAAVAALAMLAPPAFVVFDVLRQLERVRAGLLAIDEGRMSESVSLAAGPLAPALIMLETLRIHLRAMFCDVLISADQVETDARQLDGDMQRMVATTAEQAQQVMGAAAAVEETSTAVNEISANTDASLEAVGRTQELAAAGRNVIDLGIETNRRLVSTVELSQQQLSEVGKAVDEISTVTQLINDVADQTNLLALNAAIEAARAGEAGRGFAVVADEVRKLAERTTASTQTIARTVENIRSQTETAIFSMSRVVDDVRQATGEIEHTSENLSQIESSSLHSQSLARGIKDMLKQQSEASHDIASSMENISGSVDASNHSIEQIGQASERLRETAAELRRLTEHMRSALA